MRISIANPNTIQITAGPNSDQAAIGIDALFRYRSSTITATISGAAGVKDVFVIATPNVFSNAPQPDTDTTDYTFGLVALPQGTTPSGTWNGTAVSNYRKLGEVDWDGSTNITGLRQTVGHTNGTNAITPTAPSATITPVTVVGASGQSAPLISAHVGGGASVFSVSPGGNVNTTGEYMVNGAQIAATDLANGVTGSGSVALSSSPTFSGTPSAPNAAVDTNTTQLATTAFVLGQASSAADGSPQMDGTAARGTSTHYARADHIHPADTSRAPLASPVLTGNPQAPTPAVDDNDTSIATTAFVIGQASSVAPPMDGTAAVGTSLRYARADHVHASDTSRAALGGANTFTANQTISVGGANPTILFLNATAGQRAILQAQDGGTTKWLVGKETDNSFIVYDQANGRAAISIAGAASTVTMAALNVTGNASLSAGSTVQWGADAGAILSRSNAGVLKASGAIEVGSNATPLFFTGDVAQARWTVALGNFALRFLSDNNDATDLGSGTVAYGGGTYKPKVQFTQQGHMQAGGGVFARYGTATVVSLGDVAGTGNPTIIFGTIGATDARIWRTGSKALTTDSDFQIQGKVGFYGVTPVARPAARTQSNWNSVRVIDRNAASLGQAIDYMLTLEDDLRQMGLLA